MEVPGPLRELIDKLGQTLMEAIANDPTSRDLARRIQLHGFDVALLVEATIALHRRNEDDDGEPSDISLRLAPKPVPEELTTWSEEDRAFLKRFKISLD
jgi:hypothetical protein